MWCDGTWQAELSNRSQLIVAVFNFSLNLFWIPAYGWRGAAGSSLLSDGLLAILSSGLLVFFVPEHRNRSLSGIRLLPKMQLSGVHEDQERFFGLSEEDHVNDAPLVSILINNYNYARFLDEAIASALNQTYGAVEVIVVDDGSTDNSRSVVASYGNRVRLIAKGNGGQASAFNSGFAASSGDVICFFGFRRSVLTQ